MPGRSDNESKKKQNQMTTDLNNILEKLLRQKITINQFYIMVKLILFGI